MPREVDVQPCRRGVEAGQRWAAKSAGRPIGCRSWPRLARLAAWKTASETLEREKLAALAEFAAGAGHEINNPLTVIAGRAQLFLHEETDPERRRALALINAQAMRVYEMIADMRLFARPPQPELQPLDAGRVGRSADRRTRRRWRRSEDIAAAPRRRRRAAARSWPIRRNCWWRCGRCARTRSRPSARKAASRIDLRRGPGEVEIRVCDDGPGIAPEERPHIFDPFYSARQAGRGLGLGLSKCWRIVTNHGGRIEVESRPGGGACFIITLPQRL